MNTAHITPTDAARILHDASRCIHLHDRFESNRIAQFCGIAFEEYKARQDHFDELAAHLAAGGGCRVVNGELVAIQRGSRHAGECSWCEKNWTMKAGGLSDATDLCPECERLGGAA